MKLSMSYNTGKIKLQNKNTLEKQEQVFYDSTPINLLNDWVEQQNKLKKENLAEIKENNYDKNIEYYF